MKAVFTHKPSSIYDDLPEERYHFPRAYLRQVEQTVEDYIVYYEPGRTGVTERGRTGRRAYVATAKVIDIMPDITRADHFYAVIELLVLRTIRPAGPVPRELALLRAAASASRRTDEQGSLRSRGATAERIRIRPNTSGRLRGRAVAGTTRRSRGRPGLRDDRSTGRRLRAAGRGTVAEPPGARCRLRPRHPGGLRFHLCGDGPAADQRRRAARGPGGAHPARRRQGSGFDPQRPRPLRHRALDVRPRPDLDRPAADVRHPGARAAACPTPSWACSIPTVACGCRRIRPCTRLPPISTTTAPRSSRDERVVA